MAERFASGTSQAPNPRPEPTVTWLTSARTHRDRACARAAAPADSARHLVMLLTSPFRPSASLPVKIGGTGR
ncbi:hypothetical protein Kisp01_52410 [Kineosporia sp. NBRC 101677]|nr:hypothetical protein Kisp01_52410 [Kineosporia sp. NBRC 101677]